MEDPAPDQLAGVHHPWRNHLGAMSIPWEVEIKGKHGWLSMLLNTTSWFWMVLGRWTRSTKADLG